MLRCPTCAFENDDFATTCVHCKSFLQNRVPTLNLFETAWGIVESPRPTFRKITLAEHKNYSLFLSCAFGISVSFTLFWYARLGRFFESLLDLIPIAVGTGIALGLILVPIVALLMHAVAKFMGSSMKFRNSFGFVAYSTVPIVVSLVLVLPLELMTFGMYLFTGNPDPYVIKPVSYVMLMGFDGLMGLWALLLAVIGASVVHRISLYKSISIVLGVFCLLALAFFQLADLASFVMSRI